MRRCSHLAVLVISLAFPLCAQQPTAQVTGLIMDPSNAAVPGAVIEITNVNTGVTARTTSNASGNYLFPVLNPGIYNITVSKQGFDQISRTGIELVVSEVARFDFTLQVGSTKQTIEVSAATPPLETSTASLGQVIDTKPIEDLPLNGRNFLQLAKLAAGVFNPKRVIEQPRTQTLRLPAADSWLTACDLSSTISCSTASTTTRKSSISRAALRLSFNLPWMRCRNSK